MASCPGYSLPLENDYIRLLRLLPNEDEAAPIQCMLHNYSLRKSGAQTHLYEALSYVWGDPKATVPIYLNKKEFQVTLNLHAALSRLRDDSLERIIWVDAICINQSNSEERGQQVKLMAKIYSKAHRVIVWLGNEAEDTRGALEEIRFAANMELTDDLKKEIDMQKIIGLLNRPWFQRIWVLQEAAAARHIVMMCGHVEIDGYAFCLGVKALNISFTATPALQNILAVLYLIEGAVLRSKYTIDSSEGFSLDIRCLPELIDMFHTRKASDIRDKVYALLGMSSDFPGKAGLQPDYRISWGIVFQKLVKYILGSNVSVGAPDSGLRAVIKSKGCILGQISSVRSSDQQHICITPTGGIPFFSGEKNTWTLRSSAKPIQEGDFVCFLVGASKPTIIRLCEDHFDIIVIAVTPLGDNKELESSNIPIPFSRDFVLVWDLENFTERVEYQSEHENSIMINFQATKHSETELARRLERPTRSWSIALILGDLGQDIKGEVKFREAVNGFEIALTKKHRSALKESSYGLTPLSWAAGNGLDTLVDLLLLTDGVDPDLEDSQHHLTPLQWATEGGHEAVVKKLLKTGKVKIELEDRNGYTPLLWAAKSGHDTVVKLLTEIGGNISAKDIFDSRTPLLWAAKEGHEAVVKLLLETPKVEIDSRDRDGWTPLLWAARNGHRNIVVLLLENRANIDLKTSNGETALTLVAIHGHPIIIQVLLEKGVTDLHRETALYEAAKNGHQSIVKMLLGKEVSDEVVNQYEKTALFEAVKNGHESIVRMLLERGAAINAVDGSGKTTLSEAVENGHESIVRMLLERGAAISAVDGSRKTALHYAAEHGHQSIVRMLLEKAAAIEAIEAINLAKKTALRRAAKNEHRGVVRISSEKWADTKANTLVRGRGFCGTIMNKNRDASPTRETAIAAVDYNGMTAICYAARGGHQGVVQILLENGAAINAVGGNTKTPLYCAAQTGRQGVVQMLLEKGATINRNCDWGNYELHVAAENGHQEIVQILLEKGADVDGPAPWGQTALFCAAQNNHQGIVQILLEKGADIDRPNFKAQTALYCATQNKHQSVVQMLLEKGANASKLGIGGYGILDEAAGNEDVNIIQLFLEKGLVICRLSIDLKTPVTLVSENKPKEIIKLLRGEGAIVKGKTPDGKIKPYLGPKTVRPVQWKDVVLEDLGGEKSSYFGPKIIEPVHWKDVVLENLDGEKSPYKRHRDNSRKGRDLFR